MGWVSSLIRTFFFVQTCRVTLKKLASYSNGKHSYAFPRVMAMLGDGKTKYDQANDGEVNAIAACSVWPEFMTCVLEIYAMCHRPEFVRPILQPNYG